MLPEPEGEIDDETLIAHCWTRWRCRTSFRGWTKTQDWAKVLSPGEQQRIAFARILLTKPKAVFLDESTSALDEGLEFALYNLVRTELPDTILVSVSHRSTVEQHHTAGARAARRRRVAARGALTAANRAPVG